MIKNILIINQSSELYGSDKAILELIENFPIGYNPIVVLHEEGPLKEILNQKNIQVIKSSVIKVKRGILNPIYFLKLPFEIFNSIRKIKRELKGKKIDLIHSNSTSVFIGAFYAFFLKIPHIWHVHEIILTPKYIANLYPKIVAFFSNKIVFNSKASYLNYTNRDEKIKSKSIVIYNGQERKKEYATKERKLSIKANVFNALEHDIVFGLVGRINKWKGHNLLLEAFSDVSKIYKNTKLVFLGSTPPNQDFYLENLKKQISEYHLEEKVVIIPFQQEIWEFYDTIDISVVPSTEPEPFGLVATESMLSKKPVIAANHGGLSEIVINNETGLFFEPNNKEDLINKMCFLIENREKIIEFGENGFNRVNSIFNSDNYCSSFKNVYDELS